MQRGTETTSLHNTYVSNKGDALQNLRLHVVLIDNCGCKLGFCPQHAKTPVAPPTTEHRSSVRRSSMMCVDAHSIPFVSKYVAYHLTRFGAQTDVTTSKIVCWTILDTEFIATFVYMSRLNDTLNRIMLLRQMYCCNFPMSCVCVRQSTKTCCSSLTAKNSS
jgi:hypothetical protein